MTPKEFVESWGKDWENLMSAKINRMGLITQFGEDVRIEKTDIVLTGHEVYNLYARQGVDHKTHPVHGTETTETHVWVPISTFENEKQAHIAARKLARMPY